MGDVRATRVPTIDAGFGAVQLRHASTTRRARLSGGQRRLAIVASAPSYEDVKVRTPLLLGVGEARTSKRGARVASCAREPRRARGRDATRTPVIRVRVEGLFRHRVDRRRSMSARRSRGRGTRDPSRVDAQSRRCGARRSLRGAPMRRREDALVSSNANLRVCDRVARAVAARRREHRVDSSIDFASTRERKARDPTRSIDRVVLDHPARARERTRADLDVLSTEKSSVTLMLMPREQARSPESLARSPGSSP